MPVSGPVLHQQLIGAYQQTQHLLASKRGKIAASGAELSDLANNRSEAIQQLARHYLPSLTEESLTKTGQEFRHGLGEILRHKNQHVSRLDNELQQVERQRQQAEQRLGAVTEQLDNAAQRQSDLAQQVSEALSGDADFSLLSKRAAEAEASLQRAEANLAEIEQDALAKLPAYEESALFMYLNERDFATANYRHRGLTRQMDQWLGRFIGYRDARQGYDFLKSTPEHMRKVIASDRQSLDVVMDELERRRDEVAHRVGLPQLIAEVNQLGNERTELLRQLEALQTKTQLTQEERSQVDDPHGTYYQEAIDKFRQTLAQIDPRVLAQRAQQTIEIDDDLIVDRLQGFQTEMQKAHGEVARRQQIIETLTAQSQALGSLVNRFRTAGFDSNRAQFADSLDVAAEVQQIRDGHSTVDELWQKIRSAHSWGPTVMDHVANVASHPLTQVLVNAMAHAAAGALEAKARDAGRRRSNRDPRGSQFPFPPVNPPRRGGRGSGWGGF